MFQVKYWYFSRPILSALETTVICFMFYGTSVYSCGRRSSYIHAFLYYKHECVVLLGWQGQQMQYNVREQ